MAHRCENIEFCALAVFLWHEVQAVLGQVLEVVADGIQVIVEGVQAVLYLLPQQYNLSTTRAIFQNVS